ncbi:MAG: ankyrin repeat domain-containing protein [Rhizobiales bacterium]|nr:ankyrin repeat domain-containing protein [Hyphomicrobiales bacterium]MBO6700628.1 ankyrin repeat domain-containing protein [Hyphomicrobiales bacterium]MBO6738164.1 ankyrin repeat domain-containing protein [Hyphomicrobiales bacterium]MBO6913529.1 ankyrin repeat domain-containing protein [Hyphomicrobiales bacterium]MBO6955302.1 ankyrin repeat domain-containing protein [Hyphomicrobiales bacterium]
MTKSLDQLRRDARALKRDFEAGEAHARQRLRVHPPRPDGAPLKHADYLHVIAQENDFASWPALKLAVELHGMDKAAKLQRMKIALYHGQVQTVERLLADTPDLADGVLGLEIALYRREAVEVALQVDPTCLNRDLGPAPAFVHLARSRMVHAYPERQADMLAIADLLLAHGADVNRGLPVGEGSDHTLSPLYFAIGHADNMPLGRWLLAHGADPNDNESLYHATELGHHEGLKMLLEHGADPRGTNAMLRAMDFHDVEAVRMLLDAGALADEFNDGEVGGEKPWVVPALHQAARRMSPPQMIELLLEAGADPARTYQGCTAYGYARVFGNRDLAQAIEVRGAVPDLTPEEALLAKAADGEDTTGVFVDTAKLPDTYRDIVRVILHLPGKLDHLKRLVALGVEYDRPDSEGLTPVQVAGWEGLPEMMAYILSLSPDLSHVNGYGGTLLSTIIHGSENCPQRAERDYLGCLELALRLGVALPRRALTLAGDPEVATFLADWAEAHPGQVVEGGAA